MHVRTLFLLAALAASPASAAPRKPACEAGSFRPRGAAECTTIAGHEGEPAAQRAALRQRQAGERAALKAKHAAERAALKAKLSK